VVELAARELTGRLWPDGVYLHHGCELLMFMQPGVVDIVSLVVGTGSSHRTGVRTWCCTGARVNTWSGKATLASR
jgi:hypothetical protein